MKGMGNRPIHTLSGGQKQRLALAGALVAQAELLLLDEPFGMLDSLTRWELQEVLMEVWSRTKVTAICVTHDVDESVFLADRILLMSASPGEIIAEIDNPLPRPRSPEMATRRDYVEIKQKCLDVIRSESLRAFNLQNRQ